jgi:hypothetical protein
VRCVFQNEFDLRLKASRPRELVSVIDDNALLP